MSTRAIAPIERNLGDKVADQNTARPKRARIAQGILQGESRAGTDSDKLKGIRRAARNRRHETDILSAAPNTCDGRALGDPISANYALRRRHGMGCRAPQLRTVFGPYIDERILDALHDVRNPIHTLRVPYPRKTP